MQLTPPPTTLLLKGRPDDPRFGDWVTLDPSSVPSSKERVTLLGCGDDTGVVLNRGRAGAKNGPDSIRRHFYKMALPMNGDLAEKLALVDTGNVTPGTDIFETQRRVQDCVKTLAPAGTLVFLGGGHDFAAPVFLGLHSCLPAKTVLGIVNVDPHLDVRPLEDGRPHSGTPFRQILESGSLQGKNYVVFGARANRNAKAHFQYAVSKKISVLEYEDIRVKTVPAAAFYESQLKALSKRVNFIHATFDMDACSEAEGSSAAPVLGFSAWELCQMAAAAGRNPFVRVLEIAEVAPDLDPSERSSRVAAEMVFAFLRERAKLKFKKRVKKGKRSI